ncbi:superoxide dismutase [uncultured Alistipes sp.]|uniref:superoxide dismutase n=1 Tax=uncultured Alistipes sp. TaxID=538949 RepID=UPI00261FAB2A|nr:superoxide dismutase [uncultured Alistipes sp.]
MTNDAMKSSRFEIEELLYGYDALMPQISEETMRYHHDRHYATYVAKLNELSLDTPFAGQPLEDVVRSADGPLFNNAAQAWNHAFLFRSLSPAPQTAPDGALLAAVERDFGSFEALRTRMIDTAVGLFGSGWCWLSKDSSGRLRVEARANAGNPLCDGLVPLLCIDVWEHAYYIDYRNRRADAVKALWERIDWRTVGERYGR